MRIPAPFFDDPTEIAARLHAFGTVSLLDSGGSERGLWDVVAAAPLDVLQLDAGADDAALAEFIESLLNMEEALPDALESDIPVPPFQGGLIGFLSYELGRRLQGLEPASDSTEPLAVVRLYPWAVLQDRRTRSAHLVSWLADSAVPSEFILQALENPPTAQEAAFSLRGGFSTPWCYDDYASRFTRVMEFIDAGDCYQLNLGQPFRANYDGSLMSAYRRLRKVARAPFSALFPLVDNRDGRYRPPSASMERGLMSFSPERFLGVRGRRVDSYPIKGTRPRDPDPVRDEQLAAELSGSLKERAENLMIVDLLRNDIGRFCTTGSVRAEPLFELESYATVHHLVSRVSGELRAGVTPVELLLGCLPGGSITGAPKYRAMQLIDELEAEPRQSWCGTLFMRSACGQMDSNILIRTFYGDGARLTCWAGGGLVADSRPEAEFAELEHKVGALLRALSNAT